MSAGITKLKPFWMRLTADRPLMAALGEGRYRALIDNVQAQNRRLWRLVVFLVLLLSVAVYGLHRARQALPPVHIPPELRFGATLAWGEVPLPNVYMFAGYIFQQLHLWMQDGYTDYGSNIYRLQAFLTPKYRAELEADLKWRAKRGELQGRIRQLAPLPGQGFEAQRVDPLGAGRWRVWIDFAIDETVKGMPRRRLGWGRGIGSSPRRVVFCPRGWSWRSFGASSWPCCAGPRRKTRSSARR
ncbi:MAG: PFL_4703 family integrating conjugative element protein, partial [Gammaproteobacteria bacterium]